MSDQKYSLTKENFWDAMSTAYPNAMHKFRVWIDEYKNRVNWDATFGAVGQVSSPVKFHDLPIEMQWGVIKQFVFETMGKQLTQFHLEAMKIEAEKMIGAMENYQPNN